MIKQIIIKNFQRHTDSIINLEQFNVIVGKSSSGKTSIFRALRFLFFGEWDKTFPNDPNQETIVKILLNNGIEICRIRGLKDKEENKAFIKDCEGIYEFKSFGDIIPLIEKIIDVFPLKINSEDININFSLQDEPLFILSKSSITKAQWIGRLYGSHILDEMLRLAKEDKKNALEKLKEYNQKNKTIIKELSKYQNIDKIDENVNILEAKINKLLKLKELENDIREYKKNRDRLIKKKNYKLINTDDLRNKINIYSLLCEYKDLKKQINNYNNILEANSKFNTKELKSKIKKYIEINNIYQKYNSVIFSSNNIKLQLTECNTQIITLKEEIKKILKNFNKCPICGSDIKNKELCIENLENLQL